MFPRKFYPSCHNFSFFLRHQVRNCAYNAAIIRKERFQQFHGLEIAKTIEVEIEGSSNEISKKEYADEQGAADFYGITNASHSLDKTYHDHGKESKFSQLNINPEKSTDEDEIIQTSFGGIRLDKSKQKELYYQKILHHFGVEPQVKEKTINPKKTKEIARVEEKNQKFISPEDFKENQDMPNDNYFDECILQGSTFSEEAVSSRLPIISEPSVSSDSPSAEDSVQQKVDRDSVNYFDEQIIASSSYLDQIPKGLDKPAAVDCPKLEAHPDDNYFDELLIESCSIQKKVQPQDTNYESQRVETPEETKFPANYDRSNYLSTLDEKFIKAKYSLQKSNTNNDKPDDEKLLVKNDKKVEQFSTTDVPTMPDAPVAYEYMKNLLTENSILSPTKKLSKSILNQGKPKKLLNFDYETTDTVVALLKKAIIYEDENIIGLNKPYGLPVHGGPSIHHSVGKLLPLLAQQVDKSLKTLYLVHRLDRFTTGVMLLAKRPDMANQLHEKFIRQEIVKNYKCIVKNTPSPLEGYIDIAMAEVEIGGKYRMALKQEWTCKNENIVPKFSRDSRKKMAVTRYKVLSSANDVSLLDVQLLTGVKHQIRVHLAMAMNCPILGDHKYSHYSKLAPQKLGKNALRCLGIRQTKVRDLPLHLMASSIVIPEFDNGRNVVITAPLPHYFNKSVRRLRL